MSHHFSLLGEGQRNVRFFVCITGNTATLFARLLTVGTIIAKNEVIRDTLPKSPATETLVLSSRGPRATEHAVHFDCDLQFSI